MDRFEAQSLVQAGTKDSILEIVFEDAKGNRLSLSIPHVVAQALWPVIEAKGTSKPVGAYATMANEWRTAGDQDSPNVFLDIKGYTPFVFPLNAAKELS